MSRSIQSLCVVVTALLLAAAVHATPQKTSRLQGTAKVDRRTPVIGASVVVAHATEDGRLHLTTTGERGVFEIDGLVDGDYSVRLTREGMLPMLKEGVTLRFPFRAVVEVTMQASSAAPAAHTSSARADAGVIVLRGSVTSATEGAELVDARIKLTRADGSLDPRTILAGDDGTFEVGDLPAGDWRLVVERVGYLAVRAPVSLSEDTDVRVLLVQQPTSYEPSPLELMPPEQPILPEGFGEI
ncbi:MAG: carboxypeptidase regulatory-like domain-containing protein [bacterium]|nr:carboxypeptidase regulatory-like domain-containing protein [bacterium]